MRTVVKVLVEKAKENGTEFAQGVLLMLSIGGFVFLTVLIGNIVK